MPISDGPELTSGTRLIRGGGDLLREQRLTLHTYRDAAPPRLRELDLGLRLVLAETADAR